MKANRVGRPERVGAPAAPEGRSERGERRRHLKAQEGVSPTARAIIEAAFEDGRATYNMISAAVAAKSGEKISASSLARYWRVWRSSRFARAPEIAGMIRDLLSTLGRIATAVEGLAGRSRDRGKVRAGPRAS